MSDSKTYILPENGNDGMMPLLVSLCQSKGVDPNVLLAMRNNGFGGDGGWFIWVIFLFFLMGWGGNNGFSNFGGGCNCSGNIASMLNNDTGRELLMSAIQGNGNAIGQLSTKLNCDINAVQGALNAIQSSICNISNQVGLSGQQVINAIQSGNASLASQLAQCCCDNKLAICQQTNALESRINQLANGVTQGFSAVAYESQSQTCDLKNNANDNTNRIIAKLDAIEDSRKDREINTLTAQLTACNSRAERQAELAPIYKALSDIQSKQPNTVPVPYPQLTAIPTSHLYGMYGFNGYSGYNGNGWG